MQIVKQIIKCKTSLIREFIASLHVFSSTRSAKINLKIVGASFHSTQIQKKKDPKGTFRSSHQILKYYFYCIPT